MDRLKDLWSGQDLINRIVLISGLAVFLWCLVKGQGLYGCPDRAAGTDW